MKKLAPPLSVVCARELRRNPTEAETVMWRLLREHFAHARFRRQVPLRHYIVDFASHRYRIVIEIDGGQHGCPDDERRTAAIEAEGYRVIRFWNNEVDEESEGCHRRLAPLLPPDHPHPAATRRQVAKSSRPSPIKGKGIP